MTSVYPPPPPARHRAPASRRTSRPSSTPRTALREVLDRPIKKVPALRGKTVVNLFYEASTRTRASFEIAEKVLSADSLSIATATSSVQKGETLLDTARNLEAMNPDMIVIRHASSGAPHFLARHCRSAIVNAGDGAHEHPDPGPARRASPCARRRAGWRGCGWPSWATSCTAGWRARTSGC